MEKLFVYAVLYSAGYDVWHAYEAELNRLFSNDPENEEYLCLEEMSRKDAILHTIALMQTLPIDRDEFGETLMNAIKPIYAHSNLKDFGARMYRVWQCLPDAIGDREPFFTFCYADDCLDYGDEAQCRDLYEKAMRYFDEKEEPPCY